MLIPADRTAPAKTLRPQEFDIFLKRKKMLKTEEENYELL